MLSNQYAKT
jgi:hypothetical protein